MELNVQADQFSRGSKYTAKSIGVKVYGNNKREDSDKVVKNYPMLKKKHYWGNHCWSRGYFVNTVGVNEEM